MSAAVHQHSPLPALAGGAAAVDAPGAQDPTAADDNVAVAEGADADVAAGEDRGYDQPGAVETTAASDGPGSLDDEPANTPRGDDPESIGGAFRREPKPDDP